MLQSPIVFCFAFRYCDQQCDQKQLARKGSLHLTVRHEGKSGRRLSQDPEGRNRCRGNARTVLTDLILMVWRSYLSDTTQNNLPRDSAAHSALGPPTLTIISKKALQARVHVSYSRISVLNQSSSTCSTASPHGK